MHENEEKTALKVHDHRTASKFVLYEDGDVAGFVQYQMDGAEISILATEISDDFQDRGLTPKLFDNILANLHRRRLAVLPLCPDIRAFIYQNPHYHGLVPEDQRKRFGLFRPTDSLS